MPTVNITIYKDEKDKKKKAAKKRIDLTITKLDKRFDIL